MKLALGPALVGVFAAGLVATAPAARAETKGDKLLTCTLTELYLDHWDASKRRSISETFLLKFNEYTKRVTYVGGPAMYIIPHPVKDVSQDQIIFEASSPPSMQGDAVKYVGAVNRLTGSIELDKENFQNGALQFKEVEDGTCSAGTPKF
jgi:hypothetical protein